MVGEGGGRGEVGGDEGTDGGCAVWGVCVSEGWKKCLEGRAGGRMGRMTG